MSLYQNSIHNQNGFITKTVAMTNLLSLRMLVLKVFEHVCGI